MDKIKALIEKAKLFIAENKFYFVAGGAFAALVVFAVIVTASK